MRKFLAVEGALRTDSGMSASATLCTCLKEQLQIKKQYITVIFPPHLMCLTRFHFAEKVLLQ